MDQPIDVNLPIPITLAAGEWNAVMMYLGKQPYENVATFIQKILEQAQARAREAQASPHALSNGLAAGMEVSHA